MRHIVYIIVEYTNGILTLRDEVDHYDIKYKKFEEN